MSTVMANLIFLPKNCIPNYTILISDNNFQELTEHALNHLGKYNIHPRRGDIVQFVKSDVTDVFGEKQDFPYGPNGTRLTIFNGYVLEQLIISEYTAIITKPHGYQFPEFPLNYWDKVLFINHFIRAGGQYIVKLVPHLVWFDYRPYREVMAGNLTMEKPLDIIIENDNRTVEMYTWITIGMNVKVYFIIERTYNTIFHIDYIREKIMDINLCAFHYIDKNKRPSSDCLKMYNHEFTYPSKYKKSDNIIFLTYEG
jgi:hypothetical protein